MTTATRQDIPMPSAFLQLMNDPSTRLSTALAAFRFLKTRPYPANVQPTRWQFARDLRAWKKQQKQVCSVSK